MKIKFSNVLRSDQEEIMDSFELSGEEMQNVLTDLKTVNKYLGGNNITIGGISKLLKDHSLTEEVTIIDLGCGDGEMLRQCARFGKKNGYNLKLIGIDGNSHILEEASNRSAHFKNISFMQLDVFSEEKFNVPFDIALCTLFLHHFKERSILILLQKLIDKARLGVVVNDLGRNYFAFKLFYVVSKIFLKTKVARHDGLVSVARGFKRKELLEMSKKLNLKYFSISWKWAFRFQWILK